MIIVKQWRRLLVWGGVLVFFGLFMLSMGLYFSSTVLTHYRGSLGRLVSHRLHVPVQIARINLLWQGHGPVLRFHQVVSTRGEGHNKVRVQTLDLGFRVWDSLRHGQIRIRFIRLTGVDITTGKEQRLPRLSDASLAQPLVYSIPLMARDIKIRTAHLILTLKTLHLWGDKRLRLQARGITLTFRQHPNRAPIQVDSVSGRVQNRRLFNLSVVSSVGVIRQGSLSWRGGDRGVCPY